MTTRRIVTQQDVGLVAELLPEIMALGDKVAATAKKVPLNRDADTPPVIGPKEEALIMHFLVMVRQMTELARCIEGILDEPDGEDRYRGWKGFLLTGLADTLYQAKELCRVLGFNFMETVQLGEDRNEEKRAEFQRKYPDRPWY